MKLIIEAYEIVFEGKNKEHDLEEKTNNAREENSGMENEKEDVNNIVEANNTISKEQAIDTEDSSTNKVNEEEETPIQGSIPKNDDLKRTVEELIKRQKLLQEVFKPHI